jgi:HEPN domain-containing protein
MRTPDKDILHKVHEWLEYGDEDLRLACHATNLASGCPYRLIAYHAQQCAEKHLKAYLVYCGIDFPYTHNISALLELCGEQTPWTRTLRNAEELTPYAITTWYPGEDEDVTEAEAVRAIEIAKQVQQQVRTAFQQQGIDLRQGPLT